MPRSLEVLIIPDKFKGTLTAPAAARAIARGWRQVRPHDRVERLPMSDGGDGFGEAVRQLLGAARRTVQTVDAAHRPCRAHWWWDQKTQTAVVESARVIGLAMLPPGEFHPFELDTFGLGRVLTAAATKGCKRCIIGIGGSATNDAGFGLARALGWGFSDARGHPIEQWTRLHALERIRPPASSMLSRVELIVAVDVQNRLLGHRGATRIYGPQKGVRPQDVPSAEACLRRLAAVVKRQSGKDCAMVPGAGAAGGLGFGLMAFLGARVEPGIELFARHANLDQRLQTADLVITGEGALDRSSLMGKGVGEIARRCQQLKIPCLGLAGVVNRDPELQKTFRAVYALTPDLTAPDRAKAEAAHWLTTLAARLGAAWTDD